MDMKKKNEWCYNVIWNPPPTFSVDQFYVQRLLRKKLRN